MSEVKAIAKSIKGEHEFLLYDHNDKTLYAILCITDACDSHGVVWRIRQPDGNAETFFSLKAAMEAF